MSATYSTEPQQNRSSFKGWLKFFLGALVGGLIVWSLPTQSQGWKSKRGRSAKMDSLLGEIDQHRLEQKALDEVILYKFEQAIKMMNEGDEFVKKFKAGSATSEDVEKFMRGE